MGDVVLQFRLDEKLSRADRPLTPEERAKVKRGEYLFLREKYDYSSTGKLRLRLRDVEFNSDCGSWTEGRAGLETRLGEVALGVDAAVEGVRQARTARAEAEVRRREEADRARIVAQKRELERTRREAFDKLIAHWNQGRAIQGLVDALRDQATARGLALGTETRFGRWMEWAERYAADFNPSRWDLEALPSAFRSSWSGPDDYAEDSADA